MPMLLYTLHSRLVYLMVVVYYGKVVPNLFSSLGFCEVLIWSFGVTFLENVSRLAHFMELFIPPIVF